MVASSPAQKRRYRNRVRHPRFSIGQHVRFAEGNLSGTGVVDTATDDWSVIWVWTDGGSGRRMFLQGMGAIVESIDAEASDSDFESSREGETEPATS